MLYQVSRNGQLYGPYTIDDLRRYVTSGNVLLADIAKSEEMPEWVSVSQILGITLEGATVSPSPASETLYPASTAVYPDPPNLHWLLVLVISIFTCGLFGVVWELVQAAWMRKVNPRSNALYLYIAYAVVGYGGGIFRFMLMMSTSFHNQFMALGLPVSLISLVLVELAFFDMRRSLEEHFNGPEPIGLSLSGVMTFFFGPLYFQYHLSRINEIKRMARYRGAAI